MTQTAPQYGSFAEEIYAHEYHGLTDDETLRGVFQRWNRPFVPGFLKRSPALGERTAFEAPAGATGSDYLPFIGTAKDIGKYADLLRAAERLEAETPEEGDEDLVFDYLLQSSRPRSLGAVFSDIVMQGPAFSVEWATTGGALRGMGVLAKTSLREAARQATKVALAKRVGTEIVARTTIGGALNVASETYHAAFRRAIPGLSIDESGDLEVIFGGTTDDFLGALPEGYRRVLYETASEMSGGALTAGFGSALPGVVKMYQAALVRAGMAKTGGTAREVARNVAEKIGWNGAIQEYGEEVFGGLLRAADPGMEESLEDVVPGYAEGGLMGAIKEGAAMIAGFGVLGGALRGASRLATGPQVETDRGDTTFAESEENVAPPPQEGVAPPANVAGVPRGTEGSGQDPDTVQPRSAADPEGIRPDRTDPEIEAFSPGGTRVDASTRAQVRAERFARERLGTEVVWVQPGEEKPAASGASVSPGRIMVDATLPDGPLTEFTTVHELTHEVSRVYDAVPGLTGGAQGLFEQIRTVAPNEVAGAVEGYRARLAESPLAGLELSSQEELEEGISDLAGGLYPVLDAMRGEEGAALVRKVMNQRTTWERVVDGLVRMTRGAAAVDARRARRIERGLEGLRDLTGRDVSVESVKAARLIDEAFELVRRAREEGQVPETAAGETRFAPGLEPGAVVGTSFPGSSQTTLRPQSRHTGTTLRATGVQARLRGQQPSEGEVQGPELLPTRSRGNPERFAVANEIARRLRSQARFSAAYHGSPHDFDRFTTDAIGTGEGAQAYGWGLYFASRRGVAEWYKERLSSYRENRVELDAIAAADIARELAPGATSTEIRDHVDHAEEDARRAQDEATDFVLRKREDAARDSERLARFERAGALPETLTGQRTRILRAQIAAALVERGAISYEVWRPQASGYEVELSPREDEYLLWDEPVSAQSETVQGALAGLGVRREIDSWFTASTKFRGKTVPVQRRLTIEGIAEVLFVEEDARWYAVLNGSEIGEFGSEAEAIAEVDRQYPEDLVSGEDVYRRVQQDQEGGQREASIALLEAGVRGIKYLDGTSRSQGDGSFNYVVFDENDVQITGRFSPAGELPPEPSETERQVTAAARRGFALGATEHRPLMGLGQTDSERALGAAITRQAELAGEPGHHTLADMRRAARELVESDPDAVRRRAFEAAASDNDLPEEQQEAVRMLAEQAITRALGAETQEESVRWHTEAVRLGNAFRRIRSAAGRRLGMLRDNVPVWARSARERLAEALYQPPGRLRRRISKIERQIHQERSNGRDTAASRNAVRELEEKLQRILEKDAENTRRAVRALQERGIDTAAVTRSDLEDPAVRREIAEVIGAARSSMLDWFVAFRTNAILTGPQTHIRNIGGNVANMGVETWARRAAEATVAGIGRKLTGRQLERSASWQEFTHMGPALFESLPAAGRNAVTAWKTGLPGLESQMLAQGMHVEELSSKLEAREQLARPSWHFGGLDYFGFRALEGGDALIKTVTFQTEHAALSYRAAVEEAESAEEIPFLFHQIKNDPGHPVVEEAYQNSLYVAFQGPEDGVERTAKQFRDWLNDSALGVPLGWMMLPFIGTPWKVFKSAARLTPLQVMKLANAVTVKRKDLTEEQLVRELADTLLAGLVAWSIIGLLQGGDDDEPLITGAPKKHGGERDLQYRTAPPMSIRIGPGEYVSYAGYEPLAASLGVMVDSVSAWLDAAENGDVDAMSATSKAVAESIWGQLGDKTFLRSLGDVQRLIEGHRTAADFGRDLVITPMVPNVIRSGLRNADTVFRQNVSREQEGVNPWVQMFETLPHAMLPSGNAPWTPPPKRDAWGTPIERQGDALNPWDMLGKQAPLFRLTKSNPTVAADLAMRRWNRAIDTGALEGDPLYPRAPRYSTTSKGEKVIWTPDEYDELVRLGGERARELVSRIDFSFLENDGPAGVPPERIIKSIRDSFTAARRSATQTMLARRRASQ
jgi:hypothetical protein